MTKRFGLAGVVFLCLAVPAFAEAPASYPETPPAPGSQAAVGPSSPSWSGKGIACGLGMGLALVGAGIGFGRIGASALDAMARQPEVAPRVLTAMLIIAAMLEGVALAAVVLAFFVGNSSPF
jgi:F-type H+-transporting ATPase subunit c